jgi:hypothetical protein
MLGRRASAKDGPKAPVESAFPVGGRITSNGDAARHISCVKRQPVLDGVLGPAARAALTESALSQAFTSPCAARRPHVARFDVISGMGGPRVPGIAGRCDGGPAPVGPALGSGPIRRSSMVSASDFLASPRPVGSGLASHPGGAPADGAARVATTDVRHADAAHAMHPRAAGFADRNYHVVRLLQGRLWHSLCRRCQGQGKGNSGQPDHCFLLFKGPENCIGEAQSARDKVAPSHPLCVPSSNRADR